MLKKSLLLVVGMALGGAAQAQSIGSGTVISSVSVPSECSIGASDFVFGNYDILDKNSSGTIVISYGSVNIRCTSNTQKTLNFGGGNMGSCHNNTRRMRTETGYHLLYNVYAGTQWGSGTPVRSYLPGSCSNIQNALFSSGRNWNIPLYMNIQPYQHTARVGNYTDRLTIYLDF